MSVELLDGWPLLHKRYHGGAAGQTQVTHEHLHVFQAAQVEPEADLVVVAIAHKALERVTLVRRIAFQQTGSNHLQQEIWKCKIT